MVVDSHIQRGKSSPPRRVTILGSTGSIGCNTVKLLKLSPQHYEVQALTAHRNVQLLARQAIELKAHMAVIADPALYSELQKLLAGTGIIAAAGEQALVEAASIPTDWVMAAIVGAAGLAPTRAAIQQGTTIALANKECLVCAGSLMMDEVKRYGATLIPVDSEHNAIFQVLDIRQIDKVEKITLTASGGPFRTWSRPAMSVATPAEAVNHPNWQMGAKISVDSATMMNKGLELIEAYHLFPVKPEQIDILIHPESVIHSMVAYKDGSVLAQLGTPDMCTPIAVALGWPKRVEVPTNRLDLARIGQLTFEPVDTEKFPAVRLAREALEAGGIMPVILNAANEIAVAAFLENKIGFLDIAATVENTIDGIENRVPSTIEDVMETDKEARRKAEASVLRIHNTALLAKTA